MTVSKIEQNVTRTEIKTEFVICDLCGLKDEKAGEYQLKTNWKSVGYEDKCTTKISLEEYASFPDGDTWGKVIGFHICADCFRNKLIPWMKSQGATLTEQEY